jgi:hypothetical protein
MTTMIFSLLSRRAIISRKAILMRLAAIVLLCFVVGLPVAHAQSRDVLILTTRNAEAATAGGEITSVNTILDNVVAEFTNNLPVGSTVTVDNSTLVNGTGGIPATRFVTSAGGRFDLVVIASVTAPIDNGDWTSISTAIQTHRADTFVLIVDGCCQAARNIASAATTISAAASPNFTTTAGALAAVSGTSRLNTGSTNAGSFSGLPNLAGSFYAPLSGVPAANNIYLPFPGGTSTAPPVTTPANSYGLLLPTSQSWLGRGACLFALTDASPFDEIRYPGQRNRLAPALLLALGAGGSCRIAAVTPTVISNGGVGGFSFTGTNVLDSQTVNTVTAATPAAGFRQTFDRIGVASSLAVTLPAGFITTAITCTGLPSGGTATANLSTNSVAFNATAIAADASIACTFTVQKTSRLRLVKTWVRGTTGDTIAVTTTGGNTNATISSTNTGTNTDTGVFATVFSGDTVQFPAETFTPGSAAANYTASLSCSGNANPVTGTSFPRTLIVAPADVDITCTYLNSGQSVSITKSSASFVTTGPERFNIPNAAVIYTINLVNQGGAIDSSSIIVIDTLPTSVEFYNGDIDDGGPATGPVQFVDGPGASGLTCCSSTQISYSAQTTGTDFSYSPVAGYDPAVRRIRVQPTGIMAPGPSAFAVRLRTRIR